MPCGEDIWSSLKSTFSYCCCCCYTQEIGHDRLSPPLGGSPSSSRAYDNFTLDNDLTDNFALEALDTPETPHWNAQLRLRLHDNEFTEVDISGNPTGRSNAQVIRDSPSTTRESGYGRSIEESLTSSSSNEPTTVSVTETDSKTAYKLAVQDQTKCWFVFRSQLEFIRIQEYIRHEVGVGCPDLPLKEVGERAKAEELQDFVLRIIADSKILQLPQVRSFLNLDRHCSDSSSESTESTPRILDSQPKIVLDPNLLMAPKTLLPTRKIPQEKDSFKGSKIHTPIEDVPLGCEEKKMSPSDFEFLSVIGKGSFGKVMLARRKDDNKVYAVKMLNKKMIVRKNETAHVLSERSVLTRVLRHHYVVQLHFAFTTTTKIFFVLDYVNGGELFYHLQKERTFSESRTKFYGAEICCALSYMHSKGIVYRDLKPENILLDKEGHIVLTDFGLCKEGIESANSRTATFCGTPEYLAPEIILKKPYTRSVDWWTFGAVLYEMLYGLPPFYSKDTTAMYDAIINKSLKLRSTISPNARDLLKMLLHKVPSSRLGSGPKDGSEVKAHNFFATINWTAIENREVKPTFVPRVLSDDDTSNIDPVFTREEMVSPSSTPNDVSTSVFDNETAFQGFSYVPTFDFAER